MLVTGSRRQRDHRTRGEGRACICCDAQKTGKVHLTFQKHRDAENGCMSEDRNRVDAFAGGRHRRGHAESVRGIPDEQEVGLAVNPEAVIGKVCAPHCVRTLWLRFGCIPARSMRRWRVLFFCRQVGRHYARCGRWFSCRFVAFPQEQGDEPAARHRPVGPDSIEFAHDCVLSVPAACDDSKHWARNREQPTDATTGRAARLGVPHGDYPLRRVRNRSPGNCSQTLKCHVTVSVVSVCNS
jgi:hypothetical protein